MRNDLEADVTLTDLIAALERAEGPIKPVSTEWTNIIALAVDAGLTDADLNAIEGVLKDPLDIRSALSLVPEGWWLCALFERRTPMVYRGDWHKPTGEWQAAIQHRDGNYILDSLNGNT